MRVIGGRWRGRRLTAPQGDRVRPTTDRVKEAVFNILGAQVAGCLVVDICCGAGSLGIEALSRGAERALFVDDDRRSLEAARRNLEACRAEPGTFELLRSDAAAWLHGGGLDEARRRHPGPWLLLADPPYATNLAERILASIALLRDDGDFCGAVVEHDGSAAAAHPDSAWETRRYGESHITIVRPGGGRTTA